MVRGHILSRATTAAIPRSTLPLRSCICGHVGPSQASFGVPEAVLQVQCRRVSSLVARATDEDDEYDAELDAMDRMDKSIIALQTELAGVRAGTALLRLCARTTVRSQCRGTLLMCPLHRDLRCPTRGFTFTLVVHSACVSGDTALCPCSAQMCMYCWQSLPCSI